MILSDLSKKKEIFDEFIFNYVILFVDKEKNSITQ